MVTEEATFSLSIRCTKNALEWTYPRQGEERKPYYEVHFVVANSETPGVQFKDGLTIHSDKPLPFIAGREYLLRLQTER